jgi:hypothetical protein
LLGRLNGHEIGSGGHRETGMRGWVMDTRGVKALVCVRGKVSFDAHG